MHRKLNPSKMRDERLKKEQLSHEPTQTRTNRATLAQGKTIEDICREHQISPATYHRWKQKYSGLSIQPTFRTLGCEFINYSSHFGH